MESVSFVSPLSREKLLCAVDFPGFLRNEEVKIFGESKKGNREKYSFNFFNKIKSVCKYEK